MSYLNSVESRFDEGIMDIEKNLDSLKKSQEFLENFQGILKSINELEVQQSALEHDVTLKD